MSFNIEGNDITLTRGDSLFLQISLTKNDEEYTPEEGSTIRFAMKKKYTDPDENVLVNKQVPLDTMILEIEPKDTKPLTMKQKYVYDVELTDSGGHVYTFIQGTFTIGEEVL